MSIEERSEAILANIFAELELSMAADYYNNMKEN